MAKYISTLALFFMLIMPNLATANTNKVAEESIKQQIEALKSGTLAESKESNTQVQHLGGALYFLEQTAKQKEELKNLEIKVKNIPNEMAKIQENIRELKADIDYFTGNKYKVYSIEELEKEQIKLQTELQAVQNDISELGTGVANSRHLLANNQKLSENNAKRVQEISALRSNTDISKALNDKLNAELEFIAENNKYNQYLNQNADILTEFDEAKRAEALIKQQFLQKQLSMLQDELNAKRLQESEEKAQAVENQKLNSAITNFLIQEELDYNAELSQFLLKQTQQLNNLSQDNLRIKNALESLTQTQRNIEEQISVLQGTLVLSKIVNKQKQLLPTEELNQNLSKVISDVRVHIFEYNQQRDEIYDAENYINNLDKTLEEPFLPEERVELNKIIHDRQKILDDIIKSLNSQLSLSINIENNQKQVVAISDSLQEKLQQQSFWVKSNNPIDLAWLKEFPSSAIKEIAELTRYIGFDNLKTNLAPAVGFMLLLWGFYGLIIWKKPQIKDRLLKLASQVNTLKNDSHWHSPEAMLWTIILALPSTLMFMMGYSVIVYLFFHDPLVGWRWGMKLTLYWLFFATTLSLLRPNGLAYRHFGMPQQSNKIFQRIIRQSIWIVGVLVISSVPSLVENIGYLNDTVGQVMTIIALALCLFVIRPLLDRGILEYQNAKTEDGSKRSVSLFKLLRLVLIVVPISLIVLIILGYYYTAVYLINHLLNSYFVVLCWVFGRYFAYRSVTISARRLAYRRLQDRRQKLREQAQASEQSKDDLSEENVIKLSVVNQQIFRVTDFLGWVLLFALLYVLWSDLISVAYYLNGVILWESNDGTQVESVTLLNLLRASLYIMITYVLVKNIAGILEVMVFSKIKLSKGTPHTIVRILNYIIIAMGSIFAFTSIGISWSKVQWVFTALSVGLGFGVREIFGSFVSGSILLFERPIRVGDKVTVGQHTGIITNIRLRSTTLINSDNMEVVLPNQAFVTDRFINWTLKNTITRVQIFIKIGYGTDLDLVKKLLFQAISEAPKVVEDPKPEVNILNFGENALEHEVVVFVGELGDRTDTQNFLHYRINQLFNESHVRFAFKQLEVHLHNDNAEKPSKASSQAVEMIENFANLQK